MKRRNFLATIGALPAFAWLRPTKLNDKPFRFANRPQQTGKAVYRMRDGTMIYPEETDIVHCEVSRSPTIPQIGDSLPANMEYKAIFVDSYCAIPRDNIWYILAQYRRQAL